MPFCCAFRVVFYLWATGRFGVCDWAGRTRIYITGNGGTPPSASQAISVSYITNIDGFVKSPEAALRFILRHCGVRKVRLTSQDLRALPANFLRSRLSFDFQITSPKLFDDTAPQSGVTKLFTKPSTTAHNAIGSFFRTFIYLPSFRPDYQFAMIHVKHVRKNDGCPAPYRVRVERLHKKTPATFSDDIRLPVYGRLYFRSFDSCFNIFHPLPPLPLSGLLVIYS